MPVENQQTTPDGNEPPRDDWEGLAHDAAHNWDFKHPGVRGLYENHVVPQLHSKGLGHLVVSQADRAGGQFLHEQSSGSQPLHRSRPVEYAVAQTAERIGQKAPQNPPKN